MYLPAHFAAPDDAAVRDLLAGLGAADLVTSTDEGLRATPLPLVHDAPAEPTGGWGSLLGHLARNNDQWRLPARGEALVIVRGPDAYVSPSWYPTKREHGRVVPTWNYVAAHVYGQLVVHDDPVWVERLVRCLTERHEAGMAHPWSVDDAPRRYVEGQLRAVVGVELRITRVEAKWKLSQNRSGEDRAGVVAGLRGDPSAGAGAVAAAMRHLAG